MNLNFSKKVVLVSGGGAGIGLTIAKSFLVSGANVVITGRREEVLEKASQTLVKELGDIDKRFTFMSCDMSELSSVENVASNTLKQFGKLDILVNNSGVWSTKKIVDISEDEITYNFENILKSTIIGTQVAANSMEKNGVIINIGSFAGIMPMKNASLYSSFKSSINSFTKSAATELASLNIRVNCVMPGVIRTSMTSDYIDDNYDKLISTIPLNRIGTTEEVANSVLFLCSDMATYITGAILEVTGGKYITQL